MRRGDWCVGNAVGATRSGRPGSETDLNGITYAFDDAHVDAGAVITGYAPGSPTSVTIPVQVEIQGTS